MALARGLSTISTRKRKVKITKAKMAQYELDWRLYNKTMKRKGMHDLRYDSVDEYNEVFEELHEKYSTKVQMAPEIKLLFSVT